MDTGKLLIFCQFKFFSDEFTEVLISIDKFHYFSLLPFNDGGGVGQFSVMVAKLVI